MLVTRLLGPYIRLKWQDALRCRQLCAFGGSRQATAGPGLPHVSRRLLDRQVRVGLQRRIALGCRTDLFVRANLKSRGVRLRVDPIELACVQVAFGVVGFLLGEIPRTRA